ncbi:MAG: translation initiation factor IF-2 [Phycisphaeraceae bacterium]|nr:translation initiation factor IF-2 [Phycisphaeraceae bacterium]
MPPKAVVDKCWAEGIPKDKIKGHMSTVSAGLEASIREWFTAGAAVTAVESSSHVDVEALRAVPKRASRSRAKSAKSADETESGEGGVATVEAAPPPVRTRRAVPAAAPGAPEEPVEQVTPSVEAPAAPPPPKAEPIATPVAVEPQAIAPATKPAPARPKTERPESKVTPAPKNVPIRPKIISPAGPKLVEKQQIKLTGPKVVRIEQPEQIERPRPRRDAAGSDSRPGRAPAAEDDGGRSPRRNTSKRKPGPVGPGTDASRGVPARRRGRAGDEALSGGMWREQDLIEREARLSRAGGFLKARRQQARRLEHSHPHERAASAAETGGRVQIAAPFTVKDLSATTGVKVSDIVKKLFLEGIMLTANSAMDPAKAQELMLEFNIDLEVTEAKTAEQIVTEQFTDRAAVDVRARGPIVTILGHVDHGKTSLLDKIRNANVAAGEAGGITQATSAFRVPVKVGGETKHIVFLDTPGHEAFTQMRARGAAITDIVVLVVSAPEGVMPQTIESVNHAKAAGVPIVVALNKIDRPDATEARVNQTLSQLAEAGLNPREWGGDTDIVRTSATKGVGIEELLEHLDFAGQVLDLKADYGGPARGTVVEAKIEEGRGATANVIVQDGQLHVGDFVVAGRAFGRVRDIMDDRGNRLKEAGPATPVRISGIDVIPNAGDKFYIVESLKQAQEAAEQRRERERETHLAQPKVTLDSLLTQMKDAAVKEIRVVIKADVQGSVDVLKHEVERVGTSEVKVRALHAAVGGISESDVLLADASRAIIVGFNVITVGKARQLAEAKGVEIRTYDVIYELTDDIRKAASGMLAPEIRTEILGHADVRAVFKISKVGTVAGCFVTDGVVERDALIRVTRNGIVIENDRRLEQLKRVKDDAKEVRAGLECGMKIVGYDDIKEGDVLECYKKIEVKRTL